MCSDMLVFFLFLITKYDSKLKILRLLISVWKIFLLPKPGTGIAFLSSF